MQDWDFTENSPTTASVLGQYTVAHSYVQTLLSAEPQGDKPGLPRLHLPPGLSWWFRLGPRPAGSAQQPPPTHPALAIASGLLNLTASQLNQDAYLSNHTLVFPHKRLLLGNASAFSIPVTLTE